MGFWEVLKHLPRLLRLRRELIARLSTLQAGPGDRHRRAGLQPGPGAHAEAARPAHRALRQSLGMGLAREARGEDRPQRRPRAVPVPDGTAHLRPPRRRRALRRPSRWPTASRWWPTAPARARRLGLPLDVPVLAVLPGSRGTEIERLGRVFLEAARRVAEAMPGLRIVVPAANARCRAALDALLLTPAAHGVEAARRPAPTRPCWPPTWCCWPRARPRWKPCWPSARWWSATAWRR